VRDATRLSYTVNIDLLQEAGREICAIAAALVSVFGNPLNSGRQETLFTAPTSD
jgi:hypothetical protein